MNPDELHLHPKRCWSCFSIAARRGSEVKPPSGVLSPSSACHPAAGDARCPGPSQRTNLGPDPPPGLSSLPPAERTCGPGGSRGGTAPISSLI